MQRKWRKFVKPIVRRLSRAPAMSNRSINTFLPFLHFISCSHARVGCFALGLLLLFRALRCASLSSILHAALHLSDFLCPLHLPHSSRQTEVIKQNLSPHVLLQQSPQCRCDWWLLYIPGAVKYRSDSALWPPVSWGIVVVQSAR